MFGKLNRQTIHHHFNKAKNFLGNTYHQTKGFVNDLHHGVNTFKNISNEMIMMAEIQTRLAGFMSYSSSKHTGQKNNYQIGIDFFRRVGRSIVA